MPNFDRYEGPERRNGGTADWLAGLPIWARVLGIIGIPSGIAVFLVWMGANYLPKIGAQIDSNTNQIARIRDAQLAHDAQTEYTYRLLQRICTNTAKTEFERQRCFDR
jgi:hypothetical protein